MRFICLFACLHHILLLSSMLKVGETAAVVNGTLCGYPTGAQRDPEAYNL